MRNFPVMDKAIDTPQYKDYQNNSADDDKGCLSQKIPIVLADGGEGDSFTVIGMPNEELIHE